MAMTHVTGQVIESSAAHFATDGISAPLSMPNPAAAGSLIVVAVTIPDGEIPATSVSSIVDNDGSYTLARRQTTNGSGAAVEIWFRIITGGVGGGQDLIGTVAGPFSTGHTFIGALEFSGALADQSGRTVNGATTLSGTSHASGSVTPTTANNVLVGITTGGDRVYTGDANFTDVEINTRITFEYWIQSAATPQQHTITSDSSSLVEHAIAAFVGEDEGGGGISIPVVQHFRQRVF